MYDVYVAQLGNTTYAVRSNVIQAGSSLVVDGAEWHTINLTNNVAYKYYAIKCANNHGAANNIGLRRVEFQKLE